MSSEGCLLPHFAAGKIVPGFGRGSKELGIPTANFPAEVVHALPPELQCGVYYGWAQVTSDGDTVHKMVMCVGWNPYYHNTVKTMETHIMHQFDHDLYGDWLKIVILGYIRPMCNYESVGALITAIQCDIATANRELDAPEMVVFKTHPFFLNAKERILAINGEAEAPPAEATDMTASEATKTPPDEATKTPPDEATKTPLNEATAVSNQAAVKAQTKELITELSEVSVKLLAVTPAKAPSKNATNVPTAPNATMPNATNGPTTPDATPPNATNGPTMPNATNGPSAEIKFSDKSLPELEAKSRQLTEGTPVDPETPESPESSSEEKGMGSTGSGKEVSPAVSKTSENNFYSCGRTSCRVCPPLPQMSMKNVPSCMEGSTTLLVDKVCGMQQRCFAVSSSGTAAEQGNNQVRAETAQTGDMPESNNNHTSANDSICRS